MKIIAGKYKGQNLYTLIGKRTRPTMGYTRESIFSAIYDCTDLTVLDLFAGSGAVAFEAISRGAKSATLVEFSIKAIDILKKNCAKLKCCDSINIKRRMVDKYIKKSTEKFDLIFLDPPYGKNLVNKVVELIFSNDLLKEDSLIIIEHSKFENLEPKFFKLCSYSKKYRNSQLSIISAKKIKENSVDENL